MTKILLSILGGATLALGFSACNQNAAVNNAAAANSVANQSNTVAAANFNSAKPANTVASNLQAAVTVCDVTAYVTDKDPKGLNVRDASSKTAR